MNNNVRCFWCGTPRSDSFHVRVNEDVPPRWLSGEKNVKKSNCVPQCKECQNALSILDDAVVGYFKSGIYKDMDKVEKNISFNNNKGIYVRKIILDGRIDYAQSNGNLLLWLRKLMAGLWYKQYNNFFSGQMFILSHWISFDDPTMYISNSVPATKKILDILYDLDEEFTGVNNIENSNKKESFTFKFIPSSISGVSLPFQLLRFAIYGSYAGYCLYLTEITKQNLFTVFNMQGKAPLFMENWLKCYPAFPPSFVIELVNSTKAITPEEAAKRVRVNNLGDYLN